jgi:fructosamine-3-kinase
VSHDPSLDPYTILKTLGVQTIHAVVPVAGGSDTALWRVEHDQMTSALRVFRATQVPAYLRELARMEVAARHGIPVPPRTCAQECFLLT